MMNDSPHSGQAGAGLCARCAHVQVIASSRGSTFYLCRLSAVDPHFPKYPRLPVVACAGFVGAQGQEEEEGGRRKEEGGRRKEEE